MFMVNAERQVPLSIPLERGDCELRARHALRMGLSPDLLEGIVFPIEKLQRCKGCL
jgi:hypothetical protein